jgi:hypothetical protein
MIFFRVADFWQKELNTKEQIPIGFALLYEVHSIEVIHRPIHLAENKLDLLYPFLIRFA